MFCDGAQLRQRTNLLLTLACTLLASACIRVTFVQTAEFRRARSDRVEWYVDKLPRLEYRPVGIIEVTYPAGTSLGDVIDAAREKAIEVGCHLIVDRVIHRVSSVQSPRVAYTTAVRPHTCQYAPGYQSYQSYPSPAAVPVYQEPPPGKREFVCGVY